MINIPSQTRINRKYYCVVLFVLLVLTFLQSCNSAQAAGFFETVTPTITPISISQTGPECARSRFDVSAVGIPSFCIVWVDNFQNETGFRITLTYLNSSEVFVYEVGPDVTQLLVPEEDRPTDSQEDCIRSRQVFDANVIALLDSGDVRVGSVGGQGECWISTPTP